MGARKKLRAKRLNEIRKITYFAKLRNCPTSPRKMRLSAGLIRGINIDLSLSILKNSPKEASGRLYKLLRSAIANWESKNDGLRLEDSELYVKEIFVDSARQLKRIRTAPQGRAHRIRKRSNHVTLILGSRLDNAEVVSDKIAEEIENK